MTRLDLYREGWARRVFLSAVAFTPSQYSGHMHLYTAPMEPVLCMTFDQERDYFAVGLEYGFRVYGLYPFHIKADRVLSGGIGILSMLFQSNIFALVGGGSKPIADTNKLLLWDDAQQAVVTEMAMVSSIKAVTLRVDRILVATAHHVHVYTLALHPQLLQIYDTADNENGCLAVCHGLPPGVSNAQEAAWIAFPGRQKGHVQLADLADPKRTGTMPIIQAHEGALAALTISRDGRYLATASDKGTLIRVHDAHSGDLLYEFRRGSDQARIYDIEFHSDGQLISVTSDRGTLHVFSPAVAVEGNSRGPGLSSMLKDYLPKYFSSQWSFASIKTPETRSICCFAKPDRLGAKHSTLTSISVFAVYSDGRLYHYLFEPSKGGEGIVESVCDYMTATQ